jgi:hypothetical protein
MSRHRAIRNIHPSVVTINGESEAWDDSGNVVVIDEALVKAEEDKLKAEYTAQEYARNRQAEYPDWGTQLNKIYDDGITKWKAEMVDPIKAKYPKP